ncbi:substrate-binding domain-containing protein [Nocardioides humi]|uniref:substrate-binding domain-containing protein n=1 Tax=Nocardioides humi TaxID=449461 RepID=UPI0015E860B5
MARLAGVHPSTASRSLSQEQSGRIGAKTRERVLAAARELGYTPDLTAASLRTGRTMTIGVVIPDFSNPIWASLLAGLGETLQERDYTPVIIETKDDRRRFDRALEILTDRRVDGMINAAVRLTDKKRLTAFVARTPTVLAGRDLPGLDVPKVLVDDVRGGELAVSHLVQRGHRSIVQICGPGSVGPFKSRAEGAQAVVERSGDSVALHSHVVDQPTVDEADRVMSAALAAGPAFTSVFAHNDLMAIGALQAIRRAGMRCPDDVSVVGYNDNPLSQHLAPSLTTISLPFVQTGRTAADTLLSKLLHNDPPVVTTLQPSLIVRDSTAAAR